MQKTSGLSCKALLGSGEPLTYPPDYNHVRKATQVKQLIASNLMSDIFTAQYVIAAALAYV